MWKSVLEQLRAENAVGKAFSLCCPRHTETYIQVFQLETFLRLGPESGCWLTCNHRLSDCGHQCQARCHSESMHRVFACPKPCGRLHSPCNHPCQKPTCVEDCGNCMVKVHDVTPLGCCYVENNVIVTRRKTLQPSSAPSSSKPDSWLQPCR